MLTMKQSSTTGTSTQSPAALHTCRPPGLSSVAEDREAAVVGMHAGADLARARGAMGCSG